MSRKGQGMIVWTLDTLVSRCDEVGNCLIWKCGVNGDGHPVTTIHAKKGTSVRRYVYVNLYGKTIHPGRVLVPRCGNRLCLAKECLTQMTRSTMQAEALARIRQTAIGLRQLQQRAVKAGRAKLNPQKAADIRASDLPKEELARIYQVHPRSIQKILSRDAWRDVCAINSIFNLGG